eukprot:7379539-Prymnesium_polylepis.1
MQRGGVPGVLMKPLFDVFNGCTWEQSQRERIAVAMKAWHGPAVPSHTAAPRRLPEQAAGWAEAARIEEQERPDPRLEPGNRHRCRDLIQKEYAKLQHALKLDLPAAEVPSVEEELAAAQKEKLTIPQLIAERDTARAA